MQDILEITRVTAPMAGVVARVLAPVGQVVMAGQEICILESVKLEVPVRAPHTGVLAELFVDSEDAVHGGQDLFLIAQ